jgi:hypothetical protein
VCAPTFSAMILGVVATHSSRRTRSGALFARLGVLSGPKGDGMIGKHAWVECSLGTHAIHAPLKTTALHLNL